MPVMRIASPPPTWVRHLDRLHLLTPLRILVVVLLAIVATLIIRRFVAKTLRQIFARATPADRPRAVARHRALSSALRAALTGVVWAVAVITVISEVGVNIGGFVATATVIGGAIAFGAQTLIRDVIAGFFVLADDQYGVGDDVDLGHVIGTVERVTLRTAQVRDGEGRIWHVAHGNVLRVGNLSKASVALLNLEVARSMDLDAVHDVAEQLGAALCADEVVAPMLISVPISVGVTELTDDRIVYQLSVATRPGRRDDVRRAWRALALRAFADGNLIAPVPVRTVRLEPMLAIESARPSEPEK